MITRKQFEDKETDFNNGFITAINLFLEHKDNYLDAGRKKMQEFKISDLRLYGATDHLYDMEIPKSLQKKTIISCFFKRVFVDSWFGKYIKFFGGNPEILVPYKGIAKLVLKIHIWREKCFEHRLSQNDFEFTDKIFAEGEDILAQIDKEVFHTAKVVMNYR